MVGRRTWGTQVSPVSSRTSRTAAASGCSWRSSLPLGNVQSPYRGRCTSAISTPEPTVRHGTPPAAGTVLTVPPGSLRGAAAPLCSRQPPGQAAAVGLGPQRGEPVAGPAHRGAFPFVEPAGGHRERVVVGVGAGDGEPRVRRDGGVLVLAEQPLHLRQHPGQVGGGT